MADKIEDGGPAFPQHVAPAYRQEPAVWGMTLRDWFAGQALAAVMQAYRPYSQQFEQSARHAYEQADAMLAARKAGDQ